MQIIATWNVNSINVRLDHIIKWLSEYKPDVLAIQETKCPDENFPVDAFNEIGYQATYSGQRTYNGVAILSKSPSEDPCTDIPGLDDPQRRILAATIDDVRVINLYVPNGQSLGSDKFEYKMHWLEQVTAYIKDQLTRYKKLVVLGDFNIAPEDRDVHDPEAWEGSVHVSPPERAAFKRILELGLTDSFRLFEPGEGFFSWWDYRAAAFRRKMGLRIDHILISQELAKHCKQCIIDVEPRRWERPSDHTVVAVQLDY